MCLHHPLRCCHDSDHDAGARTAHTHTHTHSRISSYLLPSRFLLAVPCYRRRRRRDDSTIKLPFSRQQKEREEKGWANILWLMT